MTMAENILIKECKSIIRYIIEGDTNLEIARKLNYSKSTVSLRMKYIFDRYGAKNKIEFIVYIFSDLINRNKRKLQSCKNENAILCEKIEKIKKVINEILIKKSKYLTKNEQETLSSLLD